MALLNLVTNLRSLRYGHDRPGNGSSNQPYIVTSPDDINLDGYNNDFLLRGGIRAISESGKDVLRLSKFFSDLRSPIGTMFVIKQNLLSKIANKTQTSNGAGYVMGNLNGGIYNPINTLAQVGGVAFGTHLAKQGLFPSPNDFGGIVTYDKIVTPFQPFEENRLFKFYKEQIRDLTGDPLVLDVYNGGPGSILGIGTTKIRTASDRTGKASGKNFTTYQVGFKNSPTDRSNVINIKPLGLSNLYNLILGNSSIDTSIINDSNKLTFETNVYTSGSLQNSNLINKNNTLTLNQDQINNLSTDLMTKGKLNGSPSAVDFRSEILPQDKKTTIMSFGPNYTTKAIETRVNLGDPGKALGKNLYSYSSGTGNGALDKINAKPLYTSKTVSTKDTNDLVKFRIAAIDSNGSGNKTYIHFRALLDSFSDSYDGEWSNFKYSGRGENFFTYSGFNRKISLSWTVYAQSREELIPMYKKLNYLASNLAPDYSPTTGYMRGPLVTLTVGGYLYEQIGFITSLNYDIPQESPWEIGITDDGESTPGDVKELPFMIKVTNCSFTPIHSFLPRKVTTPEGVQDAQFIALTNGITNNY